MRAAGFVGCFGEAHQGPEKSARSRSVERARLAESRRERVCGAGSTPDGTLDTQRFVEVVAGVDADDQHVGLEREKALEPAEVLEERVAAAAGVERLDRLPWTAAAQLGLEQVGERVGVVADPVRMRIAGHQHAQVGALFEHVLVVARADVVEPPAQPPLGMLSTGTWPSKKAR